MVSEDGEALCQSVKTALEQRCSVLYDGAGPVLSVRYDGQYVIAVGGKTCMREESASKAARKFCRLKSALLGFGP